LNKVGIILEAAKGDNARHLGIVESCRPWQVLRGTDHHQYKTTGMLGIGEARLVLEFDDYRVSKRVGGLSSALRYLLGSVPRLRSDISVRSGLTRELTCTAPVPLSSSPQGALLVLVLLHRIVSPPSGVCHKTGKYTA
jgi:hypothetical protein